MTRWAKKDYGAVMVKDDDTESHRLIQTAREDIRKWIENGKVGSGLSYFPPLNTDNYLQARWIPQHPFQE